MVAVSQKVKQKVVIPKDYDPVLFFAVVVFQEVDQRL